MDFHQRLQAKLLRRMEQLVQARPAENSGDQENRRGTGGASLQDLHFVQNEVLAAQRQGAACGSRPKILNRAPEEWIIGQNRNCCRPVGCVERRPLTGIEVLPNCSCRWRPALDLGYDRDMGPAEGCAEGWTRHRQSHEVLLQGGSAGPECGKSSSSGVENLL